ncbi:Gfo/Idh/MocA family protein [Curtobacterium sp. ISL-83]|uniref:Gfo/Idh/MocA family protein n=1 Tax=Curtobacterium sp. ISL-83 TaxID=2819145 RepID=UPI001BE84C74|nr:Gfo/Idh/MocA family oxidoreductase [Curtobacterium sp. ISL-83]MBT2502269.1 Gfo/Idh/MocA family oxidoreductase [Curtobacterium sp. ISL-83]
MTTTSALRVGLVGAGGISGFHLPHWLRLGADVHVYSDRGAEDLTDRYGGTVASSLIELFDAVDVVDVVTPTHTHRPIVEAALHAGKDVISEKPLARSVDDARAMTELAAALGRRLYPAHVVRYFPEYRRLQQAVVAGTLGDLAVLRFARSGAAPTSVPWFADRALSGGIILDQMLHDIDIARWIAGPVTRVSARSSAVTDRDGRVEAAHVLLTHRDGAISEIAGVWGPPHLRFTTEFSVTGTGGRLEHSSARERPVCADLPPAAGSGGFVPETDPDNDPYFLQLQELADAIRTGSTPRVGPWDGVEAVRIGNAAIESVDLGVPVDLVDTTTGVTA